MITRIEEFQKKCAKDAALNQAGHAGKPVWLRRSYQKDPNRESITALLSELHINTVCREANCPNYLECFAKKTATFMLLGTQCTRRCRFCNVSKEAPQAVDETEPERVGEAVRRLGLRHVVVTSVTRDDLPDGGAEHFARTVRAIQKASPSTTTEMLIPDLGGDMDALQVVIDARPTIIGHNMETVRSLYSTVRPQANYDRSLAVLKQIEAGGIRAKTGIMLGLGEQPAEVLQLFLDLLRADCRHLTIGQYLQPSIRHYPVKEYIHPKQFDAYAETAMKMGFQFVASGPFVRSSYRAEEAVGM